MTSRAELQGPSLEGRPVPHKGEAFLAPWGHPGPEGQAGHSEEGCGAGVFPGEEFTPTHISAPTSCLHMTSGLPSM